MNKPIVFLGTDHAGLALKEAVRAFLMKSGYDVRDRGAYSSEPSDYPDFVIPTVEGALAAGGVAIVFGGSGNGECMAANKVRGSRAALCYDLKTAKLAREHNDANVLCLGSRTATKDTALAKRIVKAFLMTAFSGDERHVRRIGKITKYEKKR